MKKVQSRKERKGFAKNREKILKAAGELFTQRGIKEVTIDEIAQKAGVSKGTIYRRIGKKDKLVETLLEEAAKFFYQTFTSAIQKQTDPIKQLKEVVDTMCDIYENRFISAKLVTLHFSKAKKSLGFCERHKHTASAKKSIALLQNLFQKAIKENLIKDIDVKILIEVFRNLFNPNFYQFLRFEKGLTRGEITHFITDTFFNGILIKPKK